MPAAEREFPLTRLSLVAGIRADDAGIRREALDSLARSYWEPLRAYLRLRWRVDDDTAQDLTQDFFARALERDLFARYDASRARFRTYLRMCLDSFVRNERKGAMRLKRGGGTATVALDAPLVTGSDLEAAEADADEVLDREWVRAVLAEAVVRLRELCRERGKLAHFDLFTRYDLEGPNAADVPSYASLAEEFDLPVTQVTNFLAYCRREFRILVLVVLRERSVSDMDLRDDARELLGIHIG
jgi:DNA-directed RNA polymerase specialized sigma24 family protein